MVVVSTSEFDRKPAGPSNCFYCGVPLNKKKTYDHVNPRSRVGMGANLPANLVIACRNCNSEKSDMTLEQYRTMKYLQLLLKFFKRHMPVNITRFKFFGEVHSEKCQFQFRGRTDAGEEGKQSQELRSRAAVAGA